MPGIGGVYNPINLSLYNFTGLNPIILIDPNGESFTTFMNRNWSKLLGITLDGIEVTAGVVIIKGSAGIGTPLGVAMVMHGGSNAATRLSKMVYTSYIEENYGTAEADRIDNDLPESSVGMLLYACGQMAHMMTGGNNDYGVSSKMGAAGDVIDIVLGIAIAGRGEKGLIRELKIFQRNTNISIDQMKVLKDALSRNNYNKAARYVQGVIETIDKTNTYKKSVEKIAK